MESKTGKYIVRARPTGDIPYHSEEGSGKRFCFLSSDMIPDTNIYIGAVKIDSETDNEEEYIDSHIHDVDQTYCLLDNITLEIILGDEKHIVSAPASIYIPAGMVHRPVKTYGKGYLINILQKPNYG